MTATPIPNANIKSLIAASEYAVALRLQMPKLRFYSMFDDAADRGEYRQAAGPLSNPQDV
jgi:hypothetical protein